MDTLDDNNVIDVFDLDIHKNDKRSWKNKFSEPNSIGDIKWLEKKLFF